MFRSTCGRLKIVMSDVWNIDGTRVALGICTNTTALASSKKGKACVKTLEKLKNCGWISVVEVVSVTGQKLKSLVISRGKHLQANWFPDEPSD